MCLHFPASHLESVKKALFETGAGRIGDYSECCWQVVGQGQFRPNSNATPFVGDSNMLNCVEEDRVEMLCDDSLVKVVTKALKTSHPYEVPAYDFIQIVDHEATDL